MIKLINSETLLSGAIMEKKRVGMNDFNQI